MMMAKKKLSPHRRALLLTILIVLGIIGMVLLLLFAPKIYHLIVFVPVFLFLFYAMCFWIYLAVRFWNKRS